LDPVDLGLVHLSISSLAAGAWQNIFVISTKTRSQGWLLILIQKMNAPQMSLILNVHMAYHSTLKVLLLQIEHDKTEKAKTGVQ
jgi:hypothetical protein